MWRNSLDAAPGATEMILDLIEFTACTAVVLFIAVVSALLMGA